MAKESVFDTHAVEYDHWFDENSRVYQAEILALRRFTPAAGSGIEIGGGTGRFALPLGVRMGIEPAWNMAKIASQRGIEICQGVGESLPFRNEQFDFALLVTVICFVDDLDIFLCEVNRVIKTGGRIIVGFINRNSALGRIYESRKNTNKFYQQARFYSVADVKAHLRQASFYSFSYSQTILSLSQDAEAYEVLSGYNKGAFVTICGVKKQKGDTRSPTLRKLSVGGKIC